MRKSSIAAVVTLGIAWLVVGPAPAEEKTPAIPEKLKKFLGIETIAILQAPTRVELFRLDANAGKPKPDEAHVAGFLVTGRGKDLAKDSVPKLSALLLSPRTYANEGDNPGGRMVKKYEFTPELACRVWKDKASVDVLICLEWRVVELHLRDEQGKPVGKPRRDFADMVYADLVNLARLSFPRDKEFQRLPSDEDKDLKGIGLP